MARIEESNRTVVWNGEVWPETKLDRRIRLMSELDDFICGLWPGVLDVGGGVMREVMTKDRVFLQEVLKDFVSGLASDLKVKRGEGRYEKRARDYAHQVALEAINLDYKIPHFDVNQGLMQAKRQLEMFNSSSDERRLVVVSGCPSRNDDRLIDNMITFIMYDTQGIIGNAHVSRPFKNDRRFGNKVCMTQRIAKQANSLVDYGTGLRCQPGEVIEGVSEIEWSDADNALIQVGRAIFNGVRGYPHIWGSKRDEYWVCRVPNQEIRLIRDFITTVPDLLREGRFSKSVIREFEDRMMSAYIINPNLMMNYSLIFGLDKVFEKMREYSQDGRYFAEVYDIPYTVPEIDEACREIMGGEYDADMSVLANVARYFTMIQ